MHLIININSDFISDDENKDNQKIIEEISEITTRKNTNNLDTTNNDKDQEEIVLSDDTKIAENDDVLLKNQEKAKNDKLLDITKFEIVEQIETNTSVQIYIINNKETNELFISRFYKTEDTDFFNNDIEILTKYKHPSIIKYIGHGFDGIQHKKNPFIVMEHCQNLTLKNLLIKNKESPIKEWTYTKQLIVLYGIASAMNYLHSHDIGFGLLNTQNILLDDKFYPKILCDKRINESFDIPQLSEYELKFLAPEILREDYLTDMKASDVYSFGIIAFCIATNKEYFEEKKNIYKLITLITSGLRPDISESVPDLISALIYSCWENSIENRPSFDQIVQVFDSNLADENNVTNELIEYIDSIHKCMKESTISDMIFKPKIIDLDKYQQKNKIGEGSFGIVYKVIEKETGNVYACKISKNEMDESTDKERINLNREVNILSKLNHPSIMKFIGYSDFDFKKDPKPTIITELFDNGSLENVIEKERRCCSVPGWDDTKKLINIYGIASGVKYLHSLNILHRDLRPGNILLDEFLCPKLCDFGLSKEITNDKIELDSKEFENLNNSGFKGTPAYAAPEIYRTEKYYKPCDVYAFALIVYEIVTNEKPFVEYTNLFQIIIEVVKSKKRPKFNFMVPNCYKQLIEKCWSDDPKNRPTFEQIVDELRNNSEFITDSIDQNNFFEYVDYIDQYFGEKESTKAQSLEGKSFQKVDLNEIKPDKNTTEENNDNDNDDEVLVKVEEIEVEREKYCFIDLSKYKKMKKIFVSDFSEIYEIVDNESGKTYSAKISKNEINQISRKELMKISREVNTLSKISHPSIISFIGYSPIDFNKNPKPVIITEYSSKGSLKEILEKIRKESTIKGWNKTQELIIIYGIASSMMYLHSHDILHHDLRPSNILLDENLCPKLSDFGQCTKHHDSNTISFQSSCGIKGHPSYMAPEVLLSGEYTKSSDVYSFALVVYEIVTKEIPFQDKSNVLQMMNEIVVNNKRPKFTKIRKCYQNLIEMCWSQKVDERPPFDIIVKELRDNPSYTKKEVDKESFYKYVKFVDEYNTTFDSSCRILQFNDIIKKDDQVINEQNDNRNDQVKK